MRFAVQFKLWRVMIVSTFIVIVRQLRHDGYHLSLEGSKTRQTWNGKDMPAVQCSH